MLSRTPISTFYYVQFLLSTKMLPSLVHFLYIPSSSCFTLFCPFPSFTHIISYQHGKTYSIIQQPSQGVDFLFGLFNISINASASEIDKKYGEIKQLIQYQGFISIQQQLRKITSMSVTVHLSTRTQSLLHAYNHSSALLSYIEDLKKQVYFFSISPPHFIPSSSPFFISSAPACYCQLPTLWRIR